MNDDDLVMESTTDSPEQIADGLGVELAPETTLETVDTPTGDEAVAAGEGDTAVVEGQTPVEEEPIAEGEVTPEPARVAGPKRAARPQRKSADAAAAAARRAADADKRVLEEENAALRRRLKQLASDPDTATGAATTTTRTAPVAAVVITPDQVPDTHPELATMQTQIEALGAKPQQADFEDFDQFENARDQWIETRASLRAEMNTVRKDVARRESIALDAANRAASETADAFAQTVADARSRHADYDDAMDAAREQGLAVSRDLGQALMESPVGAEVLYHLVTNPSEVDRLAALSPTRALTELGMIEGRIAARLAGRPGAARPVSQQTRPVARTTRAPEPQRTVLGEMPSAPNRRNLNDPNLSQQEYNRLRDEMDRESGRRTH